MKFTRIERASDPGLMAEISDCGRYVVSAGYTLGVLTFQGWRLSLIEGRPGTLLTTRRCITKATARGHCVADAERIAAERAAESEEIASDAA